MNLWDTLTAGEYVMFALAAFLIAVVVIWIMRSSSLSSQNKKDWALTQQLRDYISESDIENALRLCEANATSGSRILHAGLKKLGRPMPEVIASMHETRVAERLYIERGLRWIRALAIVSPLVGLGGTLAGVCHRLHDVAQDGAVADVALLSGSIAPTLVTTIAGLIVGVLSVIAYFCLEGRIDKAERHLAEISEEFVDMLNQPA